MALGSTDKDLAKAAALPGTARLVETFRDICLNEPFYAGLAALHAFESQVPSIAAVKIDGLARFYGMSDPASYEFFSVHQEADVYHSQAEWELIDRFVDTPEKEAEVLEATTRAVLTRYGVFWTVCTKITVPISPAKKRRPLPCTKHALRVTALNSAFR